MIFSAAAEYGVRVMVELGRHGGDRPLSLKAIAEAEGLPLSYLEHIVPKLKAGGADPREPRRPRRLLAGASRRRDHDGRGRARARGRGRADGVLRQPADRAGLVLARRRQGHSCSTKLLWMRVQGGIVKALQGTTLADLVEFATREHPIPAVAARA